jgi:UDP-glucose 4-epimerase
VATIYADPSLAEQTLGWRATRSVADMARDALCWQRNNPNGYSSSAVPPP